MTYEFHPAARLEFVEAIGFYESQKLGLGASFSREVVAAIERMIQAPDRWPLITPKLRRCLVHSYPYAIIYRETGEDVLIVAVAHSSRRPGYWSERSA